MLSSAIKHLSDRPEKEVIMTRALTADKLTQSSAKPEVVLQSITPLWRLDDALRYKKDREQNQPIGYLYRRVGKNRAEYVLVGITAIPAVVLFVLSELLASVVGIDWVGASFFLALVLWFYVQYKIQYLTKGPLTWNKNRVHTDRRGLYYMRDFKSRGLPREAVELIEKIRVFFPKAWFSVSFLGEDPILRCSP